MREKLYQPMCVSCPHNLSYRDAVPQKKFGVMMHCGEQFCTGGKRARRFKKRDPQSRAPEWCPKRKNPCELRIYTLKDEDERVLHSMLSQDMGHAISPAAHRYALRFEGTIPLTPHEFWRRCGREPMDKLLPAVMELYEVLEIDDGLKPVFFYKDWSDLRLEHSFDAGQARNNVLADKKLPMSERRG